MRNTTSQRWVVYLIAALALSIGVAALQNAVEWYRRPFAGVLVDPDLAISNLGLPSWSGIAKGLTFPDKIVSVDGKPLPKATPPDYAATPWDEMVDQKAAEGAASVIVHVETAHGPKDVELAITHFDALAWWMYAGAFWIISALFVGTAITALYVRPDGPLARAFAKSALFTALMGITVFDYHTTRALVPLFLLSYAMTPFAFVGLALRLPDDVQLLRAHPWLTRCLDAVGVAVAMLMVGTTITGGSTLPLRFVWTGLFGASLFFFAITFLVRYLRAKGERREVMRALLAAMIPTHVIVGVGFILAMLGLSGSTMAWCVLPALALTPVSVLIAFVRHDLWGSGALLSRLLTRFVIVAVVSAVAVAMGTAFASMLGVPMKGALAAAGAAGALSAAFVVLSLKVGDRTLFPSRAEYKPTVEQLSGELKVITSPEEVMRAVERTVRRWLPCEWVEFIPDRNAAAASRFDSIEPRGPSRPPASHHSISPRTTTTPDVSILVSFGERKLGVLAIGKKHGGALFTSEDMDLLQTIANQAGLALAHAYNYAELERRRQEEAAAWRGERTALVETVAAEIAHEVRYPINFFRSIFKRGSSGQELDAEEIDIGCEEVDRLERLVSGLRRVAVRRLDRKPVPVVELVSKAEMLLRDRLSAGGIHFEGDPSLAVRCDTDQAIQVVVNLLSNALDAAGTGDVGVQFTQEPEGATLAVWDDGPGFTCEPSRLFTPWYTTKPGGTGLGLAIAHRIARAHGWSMVASRKGDRTYFTLAISRSDVVALDSSGMEPAQVNLE